MTTVAECTGACCVAFYVNRDPHAFANRVDGGPLIAEMVSPITFDEAAERYALAGFGELPVPAATHASLWTCRYWDDRSHLCRVYDERPAMCSEYPYGQACIHCGSTAGEAQT